MYVKLIEQLVEPILLTDINKVEIREINKNEHEVELVIMAPKEFFKKLVGKNGTIIQALTIIINAKSEMNGQKVKISLKEF